jgi:diguanylate cyclase
MTAITEGNAMTNAGETETWETRWQRAWRMRRLRPRAALHIGMDLRDEADADGDDARLARALLIIGSCHGRVADHAEALRALIGVLQRFGDVDEPVRAAAMQELGVVYCLVGDHTSAVERLLGALELHQALGDVRGQAETLNALGLVSFHRGDLDEAARAYEQTAELHKRLGDRDGIAATHNNLAKVLSEKGAHEEALRHLTTACRLWEGTNEWRALGVAMSNAGVALERLGRLRSAEQYFAVSIQILDTTGHSQGACETRCRLGRLRVRQGAVEEGLSLLHRAHADADRLSAPQEKLWAAEGLSEAYDCAGEHQEALRWYRQFHDLERALFSERSEARIQGLQAAFQLERAERDSNTDPLTGLPNRRYLDRRLREEFARTRDQGVELAVALCDLDYFKSVNDTFSHAVGDKVLQAIAQLFRDGIRGSDFCARYGGEEFVVVLVDCDLDKARDIADGLRRQIRDYPWEQVASGLSVTASIGVAPSSVAADVDDLLATADRNLYQAKHAGKDQVMV